MFNVSICGPHLFHYAIIDCLNSRIVSFGMHMTILNYRKIKWAEWLQEYRLHIDSINKPSTCDTLILNVESQRGSSSFLSLSCHHFPPSLCLGGSDVDEPQRRLMNGSYSRSGLGFRRSTSQVEGKRSWFSAFNHCVTAGESAC